LSNPLVVVVEDDPAIRDVLVDLLRSEGYAVQTIADGHAAAQCIQRINDTIGPIAAITLDLTLPGKDGASVLKELKDNPRTRQVPVVVVSANARLLSADTRPLAAAVIRKPFDILHFLDTLSNLIGSHWPNIPPFRTAALVSRLRSQ